MICNFRFCNSAILVACFLSLTLTPVSTQADIAVTATETSGDVIFNFSGSIDATGLTSTFSIPPISSHIDPANASVSFGTGGAQTLYDAGSTPANFGSGSFTSANVPNTGDTFGLFSSGFVLPAGYTGFNLDSTVDTLAGQMIFTGTTFASLEITPGTYVWTTMLAEAMTLTVGATTVPEPSSLALLGLVCIAVSLRRNNRLLNGQVPPENDSPTL